MNIKPILASDQSLNPKCISQTEVHGRKPPTISGTSHRPYINIYRAIYRAIPNYPTNRIKCTRRKFVDVRKMFPNCLFQGLILELESPYHLVNSAFVSVHTFMTELILLKVIRNNLPRIILFCATMLDSILLLTEGEASAGIYCPQPFPY